METKSSSTEVRSDDKPLRLQWIQPHWTQLKQKKKRRKLNKIAESTTKKK